MLAKPCLMKKLSQVKSSVSYSVNKCLLYTVRYIYLMVYIGVIIFQSDVNSYSDAILRDVPEHQHNV